jgi:pyruvate/2-oxoglutarate dehydrogenase complex dihydrolipoamide acyltransferase (E2) component
MRDFDISGRNPWVSINRSIVESEIRPHRSIIFANEVDMSGVRRIRALDTGAPRPPYTAFILKALARTIGEFPIANRRVHRSPFRWLTGTRYQRFQTVDVAVAAERDVEEDAPFTFADILRDADEKSLAEITDFLVGLRDASPENNAQWRTFSTIIQRLPTWMASLLIALPVWMPKQWRKYRGGASLISSPTKYGVELLVTTWTWPIGVSYGLVKKRPFVVDDRIEIRPTCFVIINYDRRVMSGAQGARFFARMCELISEPSWMTEPEST